jgi:AbrB family looped-hinge helix DNA binding protein
MIDIRTRLTDGGRVVIPAEYRQVLGLQVGDELILHLEDGEVHIFTPQQAIKRAQDLMSPYLQEGRSLADELIAERRMENE